jgi:hypothetical protein
MDAGFTAKDWGLLRSYITGSFSILLGVISTGRFAEPKLSMIVDETYDLPHI